MKETEEDTNKWKGILCSWIGRINIKMSILLKVIYKFNKTLSKFQGNFHITEINNSKIYMEPQNIPHIQSNIEKEEQSYRNHTFWCQIILQNYSNQNRMVLAQKQTCKPWNRIESPGKNWHTHEQLNYNKGSKNVQWKKDTPFSKLYWEN